MSGWLVLAALLMAATAVVHSVAGERRLIGPLVAPGSTAIPHRQGRRVLRSAWRLTSLYMLSNAAVVIWPGSPAGLIRAIGAMWLATGLFSLAASRGRHIGWPGLSSAGIAALLGAA
ncbi:MAG: hypothetical protein ACREBO_09155 [Novosphingobium sp.]